MARKLIIDGAEYEADEKVIDTLHAAQKARDEAEKESKAIQGKLDSMTAARDAAISERDQLKSKLKDESEIAHLVDEKVALLDCAKQFGVEVKSSDSADVIRSAMVKKAYPQMVLDGKSADYMAGAYEAAIQKLKDSAESQGESIKKSPFAPDMTQFKDETDTEKAFEAMNEKYSKLSIGSSAKEA